MAKLDTMWAFIGTLPIIGFILAILSKKSDKYVMYYAKEGLAIGILYLIINFALILLIVTIPLTFLWSLVCSILWIITAINSVSGKTKPTPLAHKLASKF